MLLPSMDPLKCFKRDREICIKQRLNVAQIVPRTCSWVTADWRRLFLKDLLFVRASVKGWTWERIRKN